MRRKFIEQFPKLTRALVAGTTEYFIRQLKFQSRRVRWSARRWKHLIISCFTDSSLVRYFSLARHNLRGLQCTLLTALNREDSERSAYAECTVNYANSYSSVIKVVFRCDNGRKFLRHSEHTRRWRIRDSGSRSQHSPVAYVVSCGED